MLVSNTNKLEEALELLPLLNDSLNNEFETGYNICAIGSKIDQDDDVKTIVERLIKEMRQPAYKGFVAPWLSIQQIVHGTCVVLAFSLKKRPIVERVLSFDERAALQTGVNSVNI